MTTKLQEEGMEPEVQLIGNLADYMIQCAPHVQKREAYTLLHRSHDTIVQLAIDAERSHQACLSRAREIFCETTFDNPNSVAAIGAFLDILEEEFKT